MKLSKKMDSFRCDRTREFCADDLWSLDDFKKGIEELEQENEKLKAEVRASEIVINNYKRAIGQLKSDMLSNLKA